MLTHSWKWHLGLGYRGWRFPDVSTNISVAIFSKRSTKQPKAKAQHKQADISGPILSVRCTDCNARLCM